ncbi:MAG: TIGR03960 family B12-binding radical SAM protein [Myxococcota bacterium]|nr:TIGR03960 family B12-binding radical SAM protein [Myxococcota bacterium]
MSLSNIPLRTKERSETDPLTFCGGPAVFNPEPLVYFMDFFVFGDGEDIVVEIAEVLRQHSKRADRLLALSKIEGIYVPALYPTQLMPNGEIHPSKEVPKIRKRIARDLNTSTFPVNYIVPFTKQVHDRVSLEVLRGCTQGCRFCQAGMTTRPVRERTIENIETLMERTLDATGYEEVSLVSLSTCDYSQVRNMVQRVVSKATPNRVSVTLPSLRLDSFSVELADMVAGIRRSGLTFAPEAASPRLRSVINKWIPDEELLNMSAQAYKLGWDHVKLYFMIGLPTERDDDVDAIADLTIRTLQEGRKHNPKAKVNTGVSTFVPKPFTPFQWAPQILPEETIRRQAILSAKFHKIPAIKFGRHEPEETFLEGLVSRADRRAGDLLEKAFLLGCRFDAWDEHRNMELWYKAIEECDFDVEFQFRERHLDEPLPWDHIDILIDKKWFQDDWNRAVALKHAQDCRHSKCHRCGVIDHERALCAHMLRNSIEGRKIERNFERVSNPYLIESPAPGEPPKRIDEKQSVQRLVFRIGITGEPRFLGHLESLNAWVRTIRRAKLPIAYSKGFHPHPKLAFESARPVGEQSLACYMDIQLTERVPLSKALESLQRAAAPGFRILGVQEVSLRSPALMGTVAGMDYLFYLRIDPTVLSEKVKSLMEMDIIEITRLKKRKKRRRGSRNNLRTFNARPHFSSMRVGVPPHWEEQEGWASLQVSIDRIDERGVRTFELLKLLGIPQKDAVSIRLATRFQHPELQGQAVVNTTEMVTIL